MVESNFIRRRAERLAEERYPMPAHGPARRATEIARNGFIDGMVTMAESAPEHVEDSDAQEVVARLEGIWKDEGRVRSYILADILIGLGVIDIIQISVDANCPKCDYPSIVT